MSAENHCPDCGGLIASVGATCPRCLMALGQRKSISRIAGDSEELIDGQYLLLEEIGRGAMGIVYRALQPSLNRVVAIKILQEGPTGGKDARKRFEIEVNAAAKLSHPN